MTGFIFYFSSGVIIHKQTAFYIILYPVRMFCIKYFVFIVINAKCFCVLSEGEIEHSNWQNP